MFDDYVDQVLKDLEKLNPIKTYSHKRVFYYKDLHVVLVNDERSCYKYCQDYVSVYFGKLLYSDSKRLLGRRYISIYGIEYLLFHNEHGPSLCNGISVDPDFFIDGFEMSEDKVKIIYEKFKIKEKLNKI